MCLTNRQAFLKNRFLFFQMHHIVGTIVSHRWKRPSIAAEKAFLPLWSSHAARPHARDSKMALQIPRPQAPNRQGTRFLPDSSPPKHLCATGNTAIWKTVSQRFLALLCQMIYGAFIKGYLLKTHYFNDKTANPIAPLNNRQNRLYLFCGSHPIPDFWECKISGNHIGGRPILFFLSPCFWNQSAVYLFFCLSLT